MRARAIVSHFGVPKRVVVFFKMEVKYIFRTGFLHTTYIAKNIAKNEGRVTRLLSGFLTSCMLFPERKDNNVPDFYWGQWSEAERSAGISSLFTLAWTGVGVIVVVVVALEAKVALRKMLPPIASDTKTCTFCSSNDWAFLSATLW